MRKIGPPLQKQLLEPTNFVQRLCSCDVTLSTKYSDIAAKPTKTLLASCYDVVSLVFFHFFRDRSGSTSYENSEMLDDDGTAFVPYDEELEPVATEEEAAAYERSVANDEEWELEPQRRVTGELDVGTW